MSTLVEFAAFGPLCAFISSVTWAFGSSHYAKLSFEYSAFSINFTRALIGFFLFVAFGMLTEGPVFFFSQFSALGGGTYGWLALSMLSSYGLGDFFFLLATRLMGVPAALAIASCFPAINALTSKESLTALQWFGLFVTLTAVVTVILTQPTSQSEVESKNTHSAIGLGAIKGTQFGPVARGITAAVLSACFWAMNSYSVAMGSSGLSSATVNSIRMAVATLLCLALGMGLQGKKFRPLLPLRAFKTKAYLFPIEGFGGALVYVYGLKYSPLVFASTLSSLAPVISVPIAWVSGAERVSWVRFAAVSLVVVGLALLS